MTSNETITGIEGVLQKMQSKDINIKTTSAIDTMVHFLDVTIINEDGHLRTAIYHKPTTEPYILPYTSDHPVHIRRNIPFAALLRAVRICSHVEDFNHELIRTDMSLLLNKYPPDFLRKQFNQFLEINDVMLVLNQLHEILLQQPTRREKQLAKMIQYRIRTPIVLEPKIWDTQVLYSRYTFDTSVSTRFSDQFHEWWQTHYAFKESPLENLNVKLVANTNRTLEQYFIHKKPSAAFLSKIEP